MDLLLDRPAGSNKRVLKLFSTVIRLNDLTVIRLNDLTMIRLNDLTFSVSCLIANK